MAFVPSHPIPFGMASLSEETLLSSVKLQKEQQLNGGWGRKPLYEDQLKSHINVKRGIFPLVLNTSARQYQCTCIVQSFSIAQTELQFFWTANPQEDKQGSRSIQ